MTKYLSFLFIATSFLFLQSCSRKITPLISAPSKTAEAETTLPKIPVAKAPPYIAPIKTPVPTSITVNDKAASKSVEGRYYYDLEGKRYWHNKIDGKYYLYYKGIFNNKDFQ